MNVINMNVKQRTIKAPVSVSGTGLHTGESVTMTFNPAAEKHGYKFRRIDLPGQPIIDADVDNVTDTSRGTTLTQNGASVSTRLNMCLLRISWFGDR
jgi:UDP-3-O-[3-hydroxymyristoyl] N-acetylglucosamine deacetylase/3-hydroxyacyl-[acyl-carrier-protein] dehydratase